MKHGDLGAYDDTLFHIGLIASKLGKLVAAQLEAERQVLHRIGRDYVAGRLSIDDLVVLYERYRAVVRRSGGARPGLPGFTKLWNEAVPVNSGKIMHLVREARMAVRYEPDENGSWSGESPLEHDARRPPDGQAVVYVLFDHENVPCYVGSTEKFKNRIDTHTRDKSKPFVRWVAHPCADRQAAYALEDRLLKEHKPYLNRRAAR